MRVQRSLCIHAHFYQPAREDPFSGRILDEAGAEPYHNWNEKVLATCYRSNAEMGNFSSLSFNVGPTLSNWMDQNAPQVVSRIVDDDKHNVLQYGVGNAMAQAYNHVILPLSTRRDKETQVKWGIHAFQHEFHRFPDGMWLPETAVDMETLDILAENGIQFTILAPWQVDTPASEYHSPYKVELKNGRSILIFIFHRGLSTSVSFNPKATMNADVFAERYVIPQFEHPAAPHFLMIASDGELYGHHQPYRDMFLNYLMNTSTRQAGIEMTFPALWLKEHTVNSKAHIIENTSWSCLHGVVRWRGECGCSSNAAWKKPLRDALNLLAARVDDLFVQEVSKLVVDPWQLRNEYIEVLLGESNFRQWFEKYAGQGLDDRKICQYEQLFQAQHERQRMFASCGWFFDEMDRIEPRNTLAYSAHAAWLTEKATGQDVLQNVLPLLEQSRSGHNGLSAKDLFLKTYCQFLNEKI